MRTPRGVPLVVLLPLVACGGASSSGAILGDAGHAPPTSDAGIGIAPGAPFADGGNDAATVPAPGSGGDAAVPIPPATDDGGALPPPSGAFSLATANPSYQAPAGFTGASAASGTRFFFLSAAVKNASEATPLSLAPAFFTVDTAAHLVLGVSAASAALPGLCNAAVGVGQGGSSSCALVFEVPTADSPATLVYTDSLGRSASAPITPPTAPAASCINPNSGGNDCVACMEDYCDAAVVQWDDDDDSICEADNAAAASCTTCACYEGALTLSACASVYQALSQCGVQYCASVCAFFD